MGIGTGLRAIKPFGSVQTFCERFRQSLDSKLKGLERI
jgi:hypothetical protein